MIRLLSEEYYGDQEDVFLDMCKRPEPKLYDTVSYAGHYPSGLSILQYAGWSSLTISKNCQKKGNRLF